MPIDERERLWPTPLGPVPAHILSDAKAAAGDAAERATAEGASVRVVARDGARAYAAVLAPLMVNREAMRTAFREHVRGLGHSIDFAKGPPDPDEWLARFEEDIAERGK